MYEVKGDIWSVLGVADAICITTNGIVKPDGKLVMGAGIAKAARDKFSGVDKTLGGLVQKYGNIVHLMKIVDSKTHLLSFPTKDHYENNSDIKLIIRSATRVESLASAMCWKYIAIPRPGCGLGGLDWKDVKNELTELLDDRFYIYSN